MLLTHSQAEAGGQTAESLILHSERAQRSRCFLALINELFAAKSYSSKCLRLTQQKDSDANLKVSQQILTTQSGTKK